MFICVCLVPERQSVDIERFSDRNKVNTTVRRDSLSQILEHKRFPMELTEGLMIHPLKRIGMALKSASFGFDISFLRFASPLVTRLANRIKLQVPRGGSDSLAEREFGGILILVP